MTGEGLNKMQCSTGRGKKLNFGESAASSELCRAQGWDSACPIATVLGLCTHKELRDMA